MQVAFHYQVYFVRQPCKFAVRALTILYKRNLLIPRLSTIFLQKFFVIILQKVSEYSHDPFDSYENNQ